MKLELFLAADYANVDASGKLNILGVFSRINAYQFPTRHPQLYLVIRLRPELGELGAPRQLRVHMLDADGKEMLHLSGSFNVPTTSGGYPVEVSAVFSLRDIEFPDAGTYEFQVWIDEEIAGSLPLYVVPIKKSGEA